MVMLLATLVTLSPAHAWEVKTNSAGDPLHWIQVPVHYSVNPSNSQGLSDSSVISAVDSAFSTWQSVDGAKIQFRYDGKSNVDTYGHEDGLNVVFFESSWPADWDDDLLAMALTWNVDGGEIIAMDMVVNEDHPWSTGSGDGFDLQNALTHEVGHAIGLAHTVEESATMFGSSSREDREKRDLVDDDEQAARYLYSGLLGDRPEFFCSSASGRPEGLLPLLATLFGGAFLRRRRSQTDGV